jgi:hypothetical protein
MIMRPGSTLVALEEEVAGTKVCSTHSKQKRAHVCGQVCQKKRPSRTFQEKNRILPGHNGVHPSASPHYMVVFLALELLHIQKQGCMSRSELATFSPCEDPQENKKIA